MMNKSRWIGRAAVWVAVFALLVVVGATTAQEPAPPTPVPVQVAPPQAAPLLPDAGNVIAYNAWTGDS
ncbi:MAG: hypothetical protein KBG73_09630, partial [Candidatus Promineofilum sp.]|nr:hypothetical protein [Promineifilum sp.]